MSTTAALQPCQANPYEKMTPAQLRAELQRTDEICVRQEIQIKQLTEGTLAMIKDFSVAILAHMKGDTDGVRAGLDAIVKKNVVVAPSAGAMH
jgi:hypothetical protein